MEPRMFTIKSRGLTLRVLARERERAVTFGLAYAAACVVCHNNRAYTECAGFVSHVDELERIYGSKLVSYTRLT